MHKSSTAQVAALTGLLALGASARLEAATATIDAATKYQTVRGFGASTAWGSSMSAADADLLWSTTSGAGLSLHRIRIDQNSGSTGELPIAKLAVARNVTVWATPWTPPPADKSNNNSVMGTLTNPGAFATYLLGFVKKMKDNGVPIYAVSAQNEPDANVSYESCVYNGTTMAAWVGKTMGPAFAGSGVKVMGPETQNWYGFATFWAILKADAAFMKYTDIVATHEYGGTVKAYPEIQQAGKEFWETEIYDTDGKADPGMGSALRVAGLIHAAFTTANMNAWHYWWVYPAGTDNGALWDKGTGKASKRLWAMGNYSRFVRPGYVRIAAPASPVGGVTLSAYLSTLDHRVVLVAANSNTSATTQNFALSNVSPAKVTPWVTDGTRNLVAQSPIAPSGNTFGYALPAQSVTTLVVDLITEGVGRNLVSRAGQLKVLLGSDGYRVQIPTSEAGRVELLGSNGRVLESQAFAAGSREVLLGQPKQAGLMVVNVVQNNSSWTANVLKP